MTHVVDINELYKLIPETKELEGKNFTDLKTLVHTIITAIEVSKQWEFIQYIQSKPSYFVVRETKKTAVVTENSSLINDYKTVKKDLHELNKLVRRNAAAIGTGDEDVEEIPVYEDTVVLLPTDQDVKLPWKKPLNIY